MSTPSPGITAPSELSPDYVLADEKSQPNSLQSVYANQHPSYWSFTALGILLWPLGLIIGVVFLAKSALLERKLGEHTVVMSILGLVLGGVLSALLFGNHTILSGSASSSPITAPIVNTDSTPKDVENTPAEATDGTAGNTHPDDEPQLEKGSERFSKEYGYDKVSGEITNVSSQALKDVEAETTFYDGNGNVVKNTSALLQFNPLLPGQTSPYETMDTDNPEIKTEKTSFSR